MFSRSLPRLRATASNLATLRVHGPDGKGIVAACSNLLDQRGYGIVGTEHWTDRPMDLLFLRIAFDKSTALTESASTTEQEFDHFCHPRNLQDKEVNKHVSHDYNTPEACVLLPFALLLLPPSLTLFFLSLSPVFPAGGRPTHSGSLWGQFSSL